ncbi:serine--tRNA ligase, chloroplastic/mitochondrial isoform X2 [Canna indica]|uniref:Serine--tRNA ligase, chloroplastic/mitochondrial isoform X2 n=1 Tax=Canna indica TaxID=4628 RepID=A0AAQ3KMY1_9LILI|nr:serine--tRNA ligase, chloroplastic/mitochondrial isoform X2 [Canna indica]
MASTAISISSPRSFEGEAGAAGATTRGLYRVHQFSKVEMFIFCHPEESDLYHEELIAVEDLFSSLGLCAFSSDSSAPTSRKGKGANLAPTRFVHTLNATACAVPRMIVCLLENFQQEDDFVVIPEPLRPFMGDFRLFLQRSTDDVGILVLHIIPLVSL